MIESTYSGKRLFSMLDRRIRLLAKHVGRDFSLQAEVDKKEAVRREHYTKLLKEQHGLDAATAARVLDQAMAEHQAAAETKGRQRWVKIER